MSSGCKCFSHLNNTSQVSNVLLPWFSVPWTKNSFRSHLSMSFSYGRPKKKCLFFHLQDRKKQCLNILRTFTTCLRVGALSSRRASLPLHTFCGFTGVDRGPHWAQTMLSARPPPLVTFVRWPAGSRSTICRYWNRSGDQKPRAVSSLATGSE